MNKFAYLVLSINQLVVHGPCVQGVENRIFRRGCPPGRIYRKQIALHGGLLREEGSGVGRGGGGGPSEYAVQQRAELQFGENLPEGLGVGLASGQGLHVQVDGHVGLDGGEELGEGDLFAVVLDLLAEGAFQLVRMLQQCLYAPELCDELLGGLLSDAGAAGDVVGRVAHQSQHVNDLVGALDAELGLHLLGSHGLEAAGVLGPVHADAAAHQLAVVLVGGHHVGGYAAPSGLRGQGAYDVVGLVAGHLEDGDAVGPDDVLDDGHGESDGLGRLFALGLVFGVGLVPEGGSRGVECHADVGGLLLLQHLLQGVDESQHR